MRKAIEEIFGVRVDGVRTAWVKPKPKRRGISKPGHRRKWKKAVRDGCIRTTQIELFEGQGIFSI